MTLEETEGSLTEGTASAGTNMAATLNGTVAVSVGGGGGRATQGSKRRGMEEA